MKNDKVKKVVPYRRDSEFFFRVGLRYASAGRLENARRFLKKAADKEPFNADFQLNLACVLAELNDIKKSNEILLNIIKNMDPTLGECYFGLACNYFDAGNFKKARENFEKYLFYDTDGKFSDEAYDILYYLQIYDGMGSGARSGKAVSRLEMEGRRLLEEGDYKKAGQKFEKIIEADPEVISPRNNLSLTYFLSGNTDKAISLAKSVLKLDPANIQANCNLAIFYASDRELCLKQLDALAELEINDKSDLMKVIYTFSELKEQSGIAGILENFVRNNPRAVQTLKSFLKDGEMEQSLKTEIEGVLKRSRSLVPANRTGPASKKVINIKNHTRRRN